MTQAFYFEGIHYRREWIKCGRKCADCRHGPYWYAYSRRGAFLRKSYVGKKLPAAVAAVAPLEYLK
jgi:hypothetical protein